MKQKTASIRRFLLTSLVIALLGVSAVLIVTTYLGTQEELAELYNRNLEQVASVIKAQHATELYSDVIDADFSHQPAHITREEDFFIRITDDHGHIRYLSHSAVDLPVVTQEKFSTINYKGRRWRFYVTRDKGDLIEVAQSVDLRKEAILEVTLSLIMPNILFIPILGLFIWLAVGKSLRPLENLSNSIRNREHQLLEPVSEQNVPIEIIPLVKAFNILLDRLSGMVGILRQFTSDAAHELRTPLTALKLQISLVERAKNEKERNLALESLKEGSDRAIALVQQLLTLARMEPNAMENRFESVNIYELIEALMRFFEQVARNKKILINLECTENIFLTGNREALRVMLSNLIDNALRYTPENGNIDIKIYQHGNETGFEIADTGPGIPVEERKRVFDRFYRLAGNDMPGSGLGLAIAKQIADQHNASIALTDNIPHGLKVIVSFPAKGYPEPEAMSEHN